MLVTSAPGTKCPMEGKPREYITADVAVTVPDSTYYKRLVDDGSLVIAPEAKPKTAPKGGNA